MENSTMARVRRLYGGAFRITFVVTIAFGCSGSTASTPAPTGPTAGSATAADPDLPVADSQAPTLPLRPCTSFKTIPTPIVRNTLVEDTCLDIPANAVVKVNPGVTLIVIAKRQLRFGSGATIDLRGDVGTKGDARKKEEDVWRAEDPNRGEKIACACRDQSCRDGWGHCSPSGNPDLRGGKGKPGTAAGNLHIVAYEVVNAQGARVLGTGGDGGPPGDSGHTHCWEGKDGGMECNSGAAPNDGPGDPGADGKMAYEAGTKTADVQLAAVVAGTTVRAPSSSNPTRHIVDTPASFREAVTTARQDGHDYDNVPGH